MPEFLKRRIIINARQSYTQIFSQEGEDILLERFIGKKAYGIYIDVGAHHPSHISNTYFFYNKGWRGINIDAQPGSMQLFNKLRPYDINVEQAISDIDGELVFYKFNSPELNTFDESKVSDFLKFPNVQLIGKCNLTTKKLSVILDEHLSKLGSTHIDFLTVDVEGFDLKVLRSNDWSRYRPSYVLAEDLFSNIYNSYNSVLNNFMMSVGYTMKAKTFNTILFERDA